MEPHYYKKTDPYRGCGVCQYGPGAYVHNHENVRKWMAIQVIKSIKDCYEVAKSNNELSRSMVGEITPEKLKALADEYEILKNYEEKK
jgi:hypothetical protein